MYIKSSQARNTSLAFVPESLQLSYSFNNINFVQIKAYRHMIRGENHTTSFGIATLYVGNRFHKHLTELTYEQALDVLSISQALWDTLHSFNGEIFKTSVVARKTPELNEDYDPHTLTQMRADCTFMPEHLDGWYKKSAALSNFEKELLATQGD